MRDELDPDATVQDTISPGADWVEIGTEKKHVITYLGDFLFPPERARSPVRSLSGGERNRLLLARLFARPANVLVLDEPTNDLDIETLELLEALLQDYRGTIFLVSHDRAFLDNVVTQVIAFEGDGVLREYVGGYSDWAAYQARGDDAERDAEAPAKTARSRDQRAQKNESAASKRSAPDSTRADESAARPTRLTFTEERELAALPARIETLEARVASIRDRLGDASLYRDRPEEARALRGDLAEAEVGLADAFARWETLEQRKGTAGRTDS